MWQTGVSMNNYQDDLIGMFLTKPELLDITILKPQFFDKKHRIIFNAVNGFPK